MYKVEKVTVDKKTSTVHTLFKSAVLKDCIRFLYSCRDRNDIFISDRTGTVVDVGDYVDQSY